MKKDEFDLKNLPVECQDSEISQDDFKFVDNANRSHEQKFQTKPTTFFKDSLKRFAKNKSSVVASVLLGLLLTNIGAWGVLPIYSTILMVCAGIVFFFVKAPRANDTGMNVKGLDALGSED